ncbi:M14 metallopeptidase family protein [Lacinutrix iliipiscaria]|uniref:M14 metallopeptidase family protein n=1 Tax=Lacinutrix iliipiscaria TaxID=1230532 RepID=A0ABW5WPQ3_9FLAO
MCLDLLNSLFITHKETHLYHRYIYTKDIEPLLVKLGSNFKIDVIGKSVNDENIYSVTIGSGKKKVFMWSQMHGNESTTTKAVFDLLNTLSVENIYSDAILKACTIRIIPILNPDGAKAYTRLNANEIDLNRDAQDLSQPESRVLRECFNDFKPDFCFNLHGQRTIFSAGKSNHPATVSFLAPAQDEACSITPNRKKAMEIISVMNANLQDQIPNMVGIYDDAFNLNCVGDTFQSFNIPTILFEAGHYHNDYEREKVRAYVFQSLLVSLNYIAQNEVSGDFYKEYLKIPQNEKLFFDIIIRNAKIEAQEELVDVAIQYQEQLINDKIEFIPKVENIIAPLQFFAHKEINAKGETVLNSEYKPLVIGSEIDFIYINDIKLSLKLTFS